MDLNRTSIIDIFNYVLFALKSPQSCQMYLCENSHRVVCADLLMVIRREWLDPQK